MLRWLAALAAQPPAWQAEPAHVAICHLEILSMPIAYHFARLEFSNCRFWNCMAEQHGNLDWQPSSLAPWSNSLGAWPGNLTIRRLCNWAWQPKIRHNSHEMPCVDILCLYMVNKCVP